MLKYFGLTFIFCIVVLSLIAGWLFPYDFNFLDLSKGLQAPSFSHIFGLDEHGQDLFIKVIYGAKLSLLVTFSTVFLSLIIGLVLGLLAGFFGSYIEAVIISVADLVLAFPKFLIALALLAMTGPSVTNLIFALTFSTWAGFARLVRGEVKHLKEKEFVLSAKSYGASVFLQLSRHILPNIVGLLSVHATFQAVAVLIAESGLSFLGLGSSLKVPSWGGLLSAGRAHLLEAPHLVIFPSLVLFLFLLSLNFLGEALREYFDPWAKG